MREKERSFPMRIRIAVAVSEKGKWYATGGSDSGTDEDKIGLALECLDCAGDYRTFFVEADIPDPQPTPTIEGKVSQ
jgi:hypothetical protein